MVERDHHITYFEDEDLLCYCWCENHLVRVTREMLKRGLTFPCQGKRCVKIAQQYGWNPMESKGLSPEQMERCYA